MRSKKHDTVAMFEMLGMLGEYGSRQFVLNRTGLVSRSDEVAEWFYPHEQEDGLVAAFSKLISSHEEETGKTLKVALKQSKGDRSYFFSKRLRKIINGYFNDESCPRSINGRILRYASAEQKLAYVAGAYARFGSTPGNLISCSNASHKLTTIGRTLMGLGCEDVQVFGGDPRKVPTVERIFFTPTEVVKQRLGIRSSRKRPDANYFLRSFESKRK